MSKDIVEIKEGLMEAVIKLMTEKDDKGITLNEITTEAKVTPLAINECFETREKLIAESSKYFWKQWNDLLDIIEYNNEYSIENLKRFLINYFNFVAKYKGIFKKYIAKIILQSEYNLQASENIKKLGDRIRKVIECETKITDEKVLKIKTIALLSAIAYPPILGKYGEASFDINVYEESFIESYIEETVNSIVGQRV